MAYKGYHDYDFCECNDRSQRAYENELDAIEYQLCCIGCNVHGMPNLYTFDKVKDRVKTLLTHYKECADEYDKAFKDKYIRKYDETYLDSLQWNT